MQTRPLVLILAVGFEGGLLVIALGLGWLLDRLPFAGLNVSWGVVATGTIATVPPLLALAWSVRSSWTPLASLSRTVKETLVPIFAECTPVDFILIAAVAGVGEEALFRGVLQPLLSDLINPWAGLLGASVLFGLAHLITRTYAVMAGLFGLYLGGLAMVTGNLLVPIVVHALYDFLALAYMVTGLQPVPSE